MVDTLRQIEQRFDRVIDAEAEKVFVFLERLTAEASLLGEEAGAQTVLARELESLGFKVEWLPIAAEIKHDPVAAVPPLAYDGDRRVVVGRRPGSDPRAGRSLLINGHLDVVPVGDPARWTSPPFSPTRREGWLYGRGAADMKSGWAMVVLGLRALFEVRPSSAADLVAVGAIEEECGGNGTLASVRAGIVADAALLPEPTDLEILVRGAGVLWLDVTVDGALGHAGSAHEHSSALEAASIVMKALRGLEAEFEAGAHPGVHYNANVGVFTAGDWPSSVPGSAEMRVRIGFPPGLTPDEAHERVLAAITAGTSDDSWIAEHPPRVRRSGFRAEPYELAADAPMIEVLSAAHCSAHGKVPDTTSTNGTTDARFYLNQASMPALCYGPRSRGMHGVDEAVELASIVAGARTFARFADRWLNGLS